jgi:hypothetical protein
MKRPKQLTDKPLRGFKRTIRRWSRELVSSPEFIAWRENVEHVLKAAISEDGAKSARRDG